jgi:two-component system phosphate regulon response regulator PhoB
MSVGKPKILVVEDEPAQLEILSYNLSNEGYDVFKTETGEDALLTLQETDIDLIVLDWMLPEISGLEVCRQIKRGKSSKHIPIIMLTARGEEEDKVRGLDIGANDFIVKPYSVKELLARVRAALRTHINDKSVDIISYDIIQMNMVRHLVTVSDMNVQLGPIEFKLLQTFLQSPCRVFSRDQLLEKVWHNHLDVETRTVDVHIGRLRKQLALVSDIELIRTVRGFGYSLDIES